MKQTVSDDINSFLTDIQKMDKSLTLNSEADKENDEIFGNNNNMKTVPSSKPHIEEIEKKKSAENERLKGNECMKCKDFQEAVTCYTKSLDFYQADPATYSNRALAHLKLK